MSRNRPVSELTPVHKVYKLALSQKPVTDEYIARFESLLKKAEIPKNKVGVIIKFCDKLCKGLTTAIYNKENWPDILDEWQEATQRQVHRLAIMKEALGPKGNNYLSIKQAKWCSNILSKPTHRKKNDNVVPMEIDSAKV